MSPLAFYRDLISKGVPEDVAYDLAEKFEADRAAEVEARVAELLDRLASTTKTESARQARNRRYYENKKGSNPSESVLIKTVKTDSDAIKTVSDAEAASRTCAQVVNPSSSLRSEGNTPVSPIGLTAPRGAETARGTRLPEGWSPDDLGIAFAAKTLGPNVDPARELDRFRDYWRAVPGAKGRKVDWAATWRTWCRNAADRLPQARKAHDRPHDDKLARKQANLARAFAGSERAAGYRGEP